MPEDAAILPAYIDEAGARGLVRDLTEARDQEFGLMSAVIFEPNAHEKALKAFTPGFEAFRNAKPAGAKLHITDAFAAGNEDWRAIAEKVREEFLSLILTERPMIVYAARRLHLSRLAHEREEALADSAKAIRRSNVRINNENRPSDWRVEDDLIQSLALRLDAFGEWVADNMPVQQVDLLFDETDAQVAQRYEATINRTKSISKSVEKVKGWDSVASKRVEGSLAIEINAPFRIDTVFLGGVHVIGKEHPLVLAADIVANHLYHHLSLLPDDAKLNAPSSIAGWRLAERVCGVLDDATEDLF